jgi:tetratricopeptide (TPR) repeat protein
MERNGVKLKFIPGLFFLFLFLLQSIVCAEVKEIMAEGKYNMGDGETPIVAKSRALLQAKRVAVEQARTYVESYSKIKNFQLVEDEIQVLASGFVEKFEILGDYKVSIEGDSFKFSVIIKAWISTDEMEEMAKRVKEKSVIEDYKRVKKAYDKSQKEIEALKKQLAAAKSVRGKKEIKAKIAEDERLFQANEWFEKGFYYGMNKEHEKAMEAFTKTIELDPRNALAYGNRSCAYSELGNYQEALADANKAIELNPKLALAFVNRGVAFGKKPLRIPPKLLSSTQGFRRRISTVRLDIAI